MAKASPQQQRATNAPPTGGSLDGPAFVGSSGMYLRGQQHFRFLAIPAGLSIRRRAVMCRVTTCTFIYAHADFGVRHGPPPRVLVLDSERIGFVLSTSQRASTERLLVAKSPALP